MRSLPSALVKKLKACFKVIIWSMMWVASLVVAFLVLSKRECAQLDNYHVFARLYGPQDAGSASMAWPYVFCEYNGRIIVPDIVWIPLPNPSLRYKDMDGDKILDIVYGADQRQQIVAFKPSNRDTGTPPHFVVLRDDFHTSPSSPGPEKTELIQK